MRTKQAVSAGGVVLNPKGEVLVVQQLGNGVIISWSLPKGRVEDGENRVETAKREIYEESGVSQLEYVQALGSYKRYKIGKDNKDDKSELKTIFLYLFRTEQVELKPKDPENPEARWIDKSEVANLLTHQKDKVFFSSILNKLNIDEN